MKVETRMFKHATHLLLIAETRKEGHALNLILGDCAKQPVQVTGELTCDDGFNSYLRFVAGAVAPQPSGEGREQVMEDKYYGLKFALVLLAGITLLCLAAGAP